MFGTRRATWRGIVRWLGALGSLALYGWLLSGLNWAVVATQLGSMSWLVVAGALGLFVCGMGLNALRWYMLLRADAIDVRFAMVFRIVFAGAFASNFLPSTIGGDALRLVALGAAGNRAKMAASLVVDRALNVLAMLTILPIAWRVFGGAPGAGVPNALSAALVAHPFLAKWQQKVINLLHMLRRWLDRPGVLLRAFAVSWLSVLVMFVAVWLLANELGIAVALDQVMGAAAVMYLVLLLPISINGLGVREVAYTVLYMRFGATLEQATMLAVLTRVLATVQTLPGALWLPKVLAGATQRHAQ